MNIAKVSFFGSQCIIALQIDTMIVAVMNVQRNQKEMLIYEQ